MTENLKEIAVLGRDPGEALIEAALHLEGRGYKITGEPKRTNTFRPGYSRKMWLWKVPIEHEVAS